MTRRERIIRLAAGLADLRREAAEVEARITSAEAELDRLLSNDRTEDDTMSAKLAYVVMSRPTLAQIAPAHNMVAFMVNETAALHAAKEGMAACNVRRTIWIELRYVLPTDDGQAFVLPDLTNPIPFDET